MAITYTSGTLTSVNVNTDSQIIDMENHIFDLDPQSSPFTIFLNKAGKEKAGNRTVKCLEWRTKEYVVFQATTAFASASVTADLAVDSTAGSAALFVEVGDILYNPRPLRTTGEHMLVSALGSGGTATVVRAYGAGEIAYSGLAGANAWYVLADAAAEGSAKRDPLRVKMDTSENFTQIIKTLCSLTGTELAIDHYGTGNRRKSEQRKMGIEHQMKKERAFLYGKNVTAAVTSRTMKGMRSFISSNVYDFTGVTASTFKNSLGMNLIKGCYNNAGSDRKIALCGSYVIDAWDQAATSKLQLNQNINFYGLKMLNMVVPFGELVVSYHRQMDPNAIMIVDLKHVKEAYLRALTLELGVQTPGTDTKEDQYMEETTLRVKLEETMGYGYSING